MDTKTKMDGKRKWRMPIDPRRLLYVRESDHRRLHMLADETTEKLGITCSLIDEVTRLLDEYADLTGRDRQTMKAMS
jgi:hypothetical protein